MHHGHINAARGHAGCCFQTKKAAAYDNHFLPGLHRHHDLRVVEIPIGDHAVKIVSRQRDHEGIRACGEDQLVIRHGAVFSSDSLGLAVNCCHPLAKAAGNVPGRIPFVVVGDDVFVCLISCEHGLSMMRL